MKNIIYLDNAATTTVHDDVIKAMLPYFYTDFYNPSSLYSGAKSIVADVIKARHTIADFINADDNEIYFTSGGSEGNSWALQGFAKNYYESAIIRSDIEHHSITEYTDNCGKDDIYLDVVGVDKNGFINLIQLDEKLNYWQTHRVPFLVTIQLANNEMGTIQDIKTIAELVHKHGGLIHCDATQAFGHINIDVKNLDIDMMTASGHKIHAPKGIGFLYIKNGVQIKPIIYGTQEKGLRGGTQNVPYIIGFAKAVELCKKNRTEKNHDIQKSRQVYFINRLISEFGCTVNGASIEDNKRLLNNINVTFPQAITGEALIYMLDTAGICISSGSACNSASNEPSHVLKAIGLTDEEAMRTIRITLPDIYDDGVEQINFKTIDYVIEEIKKTINLFKGGE